MNTDNLFNEPARESTSVLIRAYWAVIVRRKWLVIGSLLAGVMIAWLLCLVLPKSYRSSTLILIEDQKIPNEYVKGIGGASIEERLTLIQQQVMSRTLLSQIIEDFKLYKGQVQRTGLESAIEGMRKEIKVETVGTNGAKGKSVEAVTISFAHQNPMTAMNVTAKLASLFIEENLKVREQLVTGVSVFLEQELHEAKTALETQEQAIRLYRTKYIGQLPEQMEANLRALDRLQTELNATAEALHSQTDRLSTVEKSIKEYQASGTIHAAPGAPTSAYAGMDPLVGRLRELERQLTTLMGTDYKDIYPDIVEAKQEIQSVKKQLAEKYGDPAGETDRDAAKTIDPYLRELIKQRNELRTEVSSVKERSRRLTEQIREIEHRVEQTPSREQEVMILMRDYENRQKNYQALLDKRLNAHVAENLEKRQKGEQFRVLDAANLPESPEKPNRLYIMLMGLAVGCGLGVGGAIFLEQLSPPFRRPEEVESVLGLPVFGSIPHFSLIYSKTIGGARSRRERNKVSGGRQSTSWPKEGNWVTKLYPQSLVAEQFRVLASRVTLLSPQRRSTVVVVTSAVAGEGKTATALNLAYVLANDLGKITLVVDADLKSPTMHEYAGIANRCGLLDLVGDAGGRKNLVKEYFQRSSTAPLWILPAGMGQVRTPDLSILHELGELCTECRSRFEYIIVDAPPIFPLADMHVLAQMADVFLLVVRAEQTPQETVVKSLHMLHSKRPDGIVLTGMAQADIPYYLHQYPRQSKRNLSEIST